MTQSNKQQNTHHNQELKNHHEELRIFLFDEELDAINNDKGLPLQRSQRQQNLAASQRSLQATTPLAPSTPLSSTIVPRSSPARPIPAARSNQNTAVDNSILLTSILGGFRK
jgi:hypothetical protein